MAHVPPRRWFQFSLRTLLVATSVACISLAWQAKTVRERRALLDALRSQGGDYSTATLSLMWDRPYVLMPTLRQIVGDERVYMIHVHKSRMDQLDTFRASFPEALVGIEIAYDGLNGRYYSPTEVSNIARQVGSP